MEILSRMKPMQPGEIHLWHFSGPDNPNLNESFGKKEKHPAANLIKQLAADYLHCGAQDVQILKGKTGKPRLFIKDHPAPLYFNHSHSADRLLVGFTLEGPIGVDIEKIAAFEFHPLLQNVLSEEESEQLSALEDPLKIPYFFQLWVRKEAVLKACGAGLSLPLSDINVPRSEMRVEIFSERFASSHWIVHDLDVDSRFAAAVCTYNPEPDIFLFQDSRFC